MLTVGRPPIPDRERRSETFRFRVQPHIYKCIEILAKREKAPMSRILERAIVAFLVTDPDAFDVWEEERREQEAIESGEDLPLAPLVITPGAATVILKNLEFTDEDHENAQALREDIDELKDAMKQIDEKLEDR